LSGVFLSKNNGASWISVNNGLEYLYEAKAFCVCDSNLLVGGTDVHQYIYKTTDTGLTWIPFSPLEADIDYFVKNGNNIIAGSLFENRYWSSNSGNNWNMMSPINTTCLNRPFFSVAIINNIIIASSDAGVYLSYNNGQNWYFTGFNKSFKTMINMGDKVFGGSMNGEGVYLSDNYGLNWVSVNDGLPAVSVACFAYDSTYLYAGTLNNSVWRRPLTQLLNVNENEYLNKLYIYPNPTKDNLTIDLQTLKNLKNASLSIFDIQGKLMLNQNITQVKTEINVQQFKRGMYIVKVNTENNVKINKFMKE
jgi:hypothetical protein